MKETLPLFELVINEDDLESGVDFISFVEKPAIQKEWLAFADQFNEQFKPLLTQYFASYNDYPKSASENAQRALDWAKENGGGGCGTAVGKVRANQLAKNQNISRETIARMASFRRHQQNKDVPYSEGCGGLMWDAWGGEEGIAWAERKLAEIDKQGKMEDGDPCWEGYEMIGWKMLDGKKVPNCVPVEKMKYSIQDEDKRVVTGPAMLANRPIYRFDKNRGAYMVIFSPETIFKIAKKFARRNNFNNVNENHAQIIDGVSMFESYLIDRERGILPPKGYEDSDDGSWFVSYVIDNEDTWSRVKKGEFTGFSVEGVFDFNTEMPVGYVEQEFAEDDMLLAKIYDIVNQWDGQ
jgi:hypothetical protein